MKKIQWNRLWSKGTPESLGERKEKFTRGLQNFLPCLTASRLLSIGQNRFVSLGQSEVRLLRLGSPEGTMNYYPHLRNEEMGASVRFG